MGRRAGSGSRGTFRVVPPTGNPIGDTVPIGSYVYHADQRSVYGDSVLWNRGARGFLERNRWYCIDQHLKLNTPGKKDGVLRAWVVRFDQPYLREQTLFEPYPEDLVQITDSGKGRKL